MKASDVREGETWESKDWRDRGRRVIVVAVHSTTLHVAPAKGHRGRGSLMSHDTLRKYYRLVDRAEASQ
jgi:hypothetical protein